MLISKIDFRILANKGLQNLIPYQPGKPIEELERELGLTQVIKLASNENPLGASEKLLEGVSGIIKNAHIYPDSAAYDLKRALSHYLNVNTNQLTLGNGSENVLEIIIKSFLDEDANAIISDYTFQTIPLLLQSYNVSIKCVPTVNYKQNVKNILSAIDAKTKAIFLVNPNNPTGTYVDKFSFEYLLDNIPEHILLIVDEAYAEYISLANFPQAITYLNETPNLIITRTFSKIFGLAALRLGYAVASREITDILHLAKLPFNVNSISLKAGEIALKDAEHIARSIQCNQVGYQEMTSYLDKLNIKYIPSVANFITIDVGDAATVYNKLLHQGIIVRPLNVYGLPNFIRVTIGTHTQNETFLAALKKVIE